MANRSETSVLLAKVAAAIQSTDRMRCKDVHSLAGNCAVSEIKGVNA